MKKLLSAIALSSLLAVGLTSLASGPAAASSQGDGLTMEVTKAESGTGGSRVITWTVTITDAQNRTFITSGAPTSTQILIERTSSRACVSAPTNFSSNHLNSGSCNSYFTRELRSDPSRQTLGTGTITFDVKSSDVLGSNTLADYETVLSSTRPFGAVVAYLKFNDNAGATCSGNLCWNLYGSSTNNWIPGQGATGTTQAAPSPKIPSITEFDSGYLLVSPGKSIVLTGTRLNCTTSVLINNQTAAVSYKTLLDGKGQLTIQTPSNLAPGRHKLTMDTCGGQVVYENLLMVSRPDASFELNLRSGADRALALVSIRSFVGEHRNDFNTVECMAAASNARQKMHAAQLLERVCKRALGILASPKGHSTSLTSENQEDSIKVKITLTNR